MEVAMMKGMFNFDMSATNLKSQRGFTMVEILVVFSLMGILSVYMIGSSFIASRERARDSQRKSDLQMLTIALEEFYNDYGYYPSNTTDFEMEACGNDIANNPQVCAWGSQMGDSGTTLYMAKLPAESDPNFQYVYRTDSDQQAWQLFAKLERDDDPKVQNYNGTNCSTTGIAVECNYGISSGNTTPDEDIL